MSVEQELITVLKTVCPRTFADFAPVSTQRPYCTFQGIGGRSLRFLDGNAADKRNSVIQINVWSDSRLSSITLARQIEDALCAYPLFTATPNGEPVSDFDADVPVYGCRQDFEIFSTR